MLNDLRSRIWVQTDGQLKTGRDVVVAALLGADEMGFATAPLIAQRLRDDARLPPQHVPGRDRDAGSRAAASASRGQPEHVVNFIFFVAEEARRIMARLGDPAVRGARRPGRPARAGRGDRALEGARARPLGAAACRRTCRPGVAAAARAPAGLAARRRARLGADRAGAAGDRATGRRWRRERRASGTSTAPSAACSRTHVTKAHGAAGLPAGTIRFTLHGSAGQSFGAWLAPGIELTLVGDANDYVGKGLSGGVLAVRPPDGAGFVAEENVIVGNTVLYGATVRHARSSAASPASASPSATPARTRSSRASATTAAST